MKASVADIMRIFAGAQATYSAVMVAIIFVYALLFWKRSRQKRFLILLFTISHLSMIVCTSIILYINYLNLSKVWYWVLMMGYLFGDVFLWKFWLHIIKLNHEPIEPKTKEGQVIGRMQTSFFQKTNGDA